MDQVEKWSILMNYKELLQRTDEIKEQKLNPLETIEFNTMDRINYRTEFRLTSFCTVCGSDSKIEMHHIKPIRAKPGDKNQWNSFDLVVRNLGRKQIPVCGQCHISIHRGQFKDLGTKELYCVRSAAPESLLNNALQSQDKLILDKDGQARRNKSFAKDFIKMEYPVTINSHYRTYFNPKIFNHLKLKGSVNYQKNKKKKENTEKAWRKYRTQLEINKSHTLDPERLKRPSQPTQDTT